MVNRECSPRPRGETAKQMPHAVCIETDRWHGLGPPERSRRINQQQSPRPVRKRMTLLLGLSDRAYSVRIRAASIIHKECSKNGQVACIEHRRRSRYLERARCNCLFSHKLFLKMTAKHSTAPDLAHGISPSTCPKNIMLVYSKAWAGKLHVYARDIRLDLAIWRHRASLYRVSMN